MNDNEEKIYDLITSKSFDELSKDERAFVLSQLGSEEAYAKMREANLAAMEAMTDDEEVPADLKGSVMAAFDEKSNKKRGIAWWKYAAAVAILVVGAFVFWPAGNPERVQIAENVERKDADSKKEVEPETEVKEEASEESETEKSPPPAVQETATSEDKSQGIREETAVANEIGDDIEDSDLEDMELIVTESSAEESETLSEANIQKDGGEAKSAQAPVSNFAEDEVASPEEPMSLQSFDNERADKKQRAPTATSMTAGRGIEQNQMQTGGVMLSEIGGPFPKSYVAY